FIITRGNCKLDSKRLTLECNNESLELSKNESKILELLFSNFPNVVKREKILTEIWDTDTFVEENTLNVAISRVRKKLSDLDADVQVVTVRMLGYKLESV
ncbi:MAG: winged helix-turn-helix domain-containing protein, partial [Clostridiaceae bacterium]